MFLRQIFFRVVVLWTMMLDIIHTSTNQYTFKKAIELPQSQLPSELAIEVNDRMLVYAERVNVSEPINTPNPDYSSSQPNVLSGANSADSQTQTYKFYVYMGKLFEKLVNSYPYDEGQTDDIGFSGTGAYGVIDSNNIKSHPYLNQTVLKIANVKDILSIRPDYKLLSVWNSSSNCQYLVGVEEFEEEAKKFVYNESETNCIKASNAQLVDLGNGLVGHQLYDTIEIFHVDAVTNILQKFNISGASRMEILNVIPFYDRKNDYSMFSIQAGTRDNYTLYEFDHNVKKYFVTNQFFNPASDCNYFDKNTCVAIFDHQQVINENIHNQLVHKALSDSSLASLAYTTLLSISHSVKYVVGFSSLQMKLKVFSVGSKYNFTLVDELPVSSELGDCMRSAKFTMYDGKVMAHIQNCNSSAEKKKSNVCLFAIQDPSSRVPICIRKIDEKVDSNFTSPILITKTEVEDAKRVCLGKWAYGANSYVIECRDTVDLALLVSFPQSLNNTSYNMTNMKLMHSQKMTDTFFVVVQVITDNSSTINITHKYRLVPNIEKTDIKIQRKEFIEPIKMSFQLSAVYNEYIISFSLKEGYQFACALYFIGMDGLVLQKEFTYQCVSYNNVSIPFRLLVQEGFNQVCLQRLDKYSYGLIDCYKEYTQGAKIRRRSIPTPLFNPNFTANLPIIDQIKNTIIFYDSASSTPSIMVFNIQEPPFIMIPLKSNVWVSTFINAFNSYRNQFAYSTPAWNDQCEEEILAFTQYKHLKKVRNPVNRSREIFKTLHPTNYSLEIQTFQLWHPDPLSIDWQSKTILASTGYHIIIPMISRQVNHTYLYFLQLSQRFEKQRPHRPTWNFTEETLVNEADLGWNTFAIVVTDNEVKIKSFVFHDKLDYHETGINTHFEKVFVTNDDRIAFTIHRPVLNDSALFYKPSVLKKEARLIELKRPGKILKTIISPNDESFLVETEKYIEFVTPGREESYSVEKMVDFVDLYLTVDPNKKFNKQSFRQRDEESLEDILEQFETPEFIQGVSSKSIQRLKKILSRPLKRKHQFSANLKFFQFKDTIAPSSQDLTLPTVIIRCKNYTLFCPTSLTLSQCGNYTSIKGDTIFATNRQGNYIAYLQKDENSTEWVHIMKVLSFGNIQSAQNVSMKSLKGANTTLMYQPDTVRLFISSSNTVYALTVAKENQSFFTKPVLYVFSTAPCQKNQSIINGQCKCNSNYSTQQKYGSQVMECIECKCMFMEDLNGNCVCPTWEPNRFMYDPVNQLCECDDNSDLDWSVDRGWYCKEKGNGWQITLLIVIPVIVPALIGWGAKKGWEKYQQRQKRLSIQLKEDGKSSTSTQADFTPTQDTLNDSLLSDKSSKEANPKSSKGKDDWKKQRESLTGNGKKSKK